VYWTADDDYTEDSSNPNIMVYDSEEIALSDITDVKKMYARLTDYEDALFEPVHTSDLKESKSIKEDVEYEVYFDSGISDEDEFFTDLRQAKKYAKQLVNKYGPKDGNAPAIIKKNNGDSLPDNWDVVDKIYYNTESKSIKEELYKDVSGIMGEPNETYSEEDLENYWNSQKDNDPSLRAYSNYNSWLRDTISNMEEVEEVEEDFSSDEQDLYKEAMRAYKDNDDDFFYNLSDDELVTLWKSCLITGTNPYGAAYDDEVYDAISDRPNSRELFDRAASMVESKSSDEFEFDDEFNAYYDGYTEEDEDKNSAYNKLKRNTTLTEAPTVTLSDDDMFDPSSISLKGLAKKAVDKEKAEIAERERQERIAAAREKYKEVLDSINRDGDVDDNLEKLFNALVPSSGKAETIAGEIVRAMMRILYRDYNDGDKFFCGYGLETCAGSAQYLMDKGFESLEEILSQAERYMDNDDAYTSAITDTAREVVDYILDNPDLLVELKIGN
jgi:hypothetical protein